MFASIGKIAYHRRWLVLAAGLVFALASAVAGYNLSESLKVGGFIDPDGESARVAGAAHVLLGRDQGSLVVLFNAKDGKTTLDQPEYRQDVEAVLAKISARPGVGNVFTFYNTGLPQFVSKDRTLTYAVVGLPGDEDAQVRGVEKLRPFVESTALLQVRLGGRPAVNEEIVVQSDKDLMRAELMTFPVVGLLLFFIFRSAVAAALPLLMGGTAILGAYLILRITSYFTGVSVFSLNIVSMLGLGLSIDYSLFVVSRFREELALHNGEVRPALIRTMQTAGHTVFFSGLTVIISLLSLLVFDPPFLKSMGYGGAMAVLVAMLAGLTILPAILALLGDKVNRLSVDKILPPALRRKGSGEAGKGYWYRSSQFVMRHPVWVLVVTLIPLLLIGSPFLRISFSTFDARTLPDTHASRQVSEILAREFPRNETAPIEVLVRTPGQALDPANLAALFDYTRQIQALPGVTRVDSLVTLDPALDKAAYAAFYSQASQSQNPLAAQAAARFSRGDATIINVVYQDDPYASTTQELVRNIRKLTSPAGFNSQVGGDTAQLVDLLSSLGRSLPLAFGLIVGILFVLLYLMLGSLIVPLKAVILNILSLSACFGTLVLVFQDGNLAGLLGFTPTGTIDSTQPVLVFAGAFGLSLDYEVFLLSRIKEHYDRTNDLRASVALGIQKTGGIITGAALLLVVVIGSFVTGEVLFIKQIGLGLAVAILVDATIVRTLLLPATMRLMGTYNWWAPAPLVKLHQKLGLAEPVHEIEEPARSESAPALAPGGFLSQSLAWSDATIKVPRITGPVPAANYVANSNGAAPGQAAAGNGPKPPAPLSRQAVPPAPAPVGQPLPARPVPEAADHEALRAILHSEIFGPSGKAKAQAEMIGQLNQLAEVCQSLGRDQEAIQHYERSLTLMRDSNYDPQARVLVLARLSAIYAEAQDAVNGLRVSGEGLQLSRQTGQFVAEFAFLSNLCELATTRGELKAARNYALQALEQAARRADASRQRRAERLLARVEAREELQHSGTGSFKQLTGAFKLFNSQPLAAPAEALLPAEELYNRGRQLQANRDYYQAIEAYTRALEQDPRLVKAFFNRAVAYNAVKDYEKALDSYNRALLLDKTDPDIWFNRGNTYVYRKEYRPAAYDYTQAIKLNPDDPDAYFNRGEAFRKLNMLNEAVADFRKVIELSQGKDQPGARQARQILAKIEGAAAQVRS